MNNNKDSPIGRLLVTGNFKYIYTYRKRTQIYMHNLLLDKKNILKMTL